MKRLKRQYSVLFSFGAAILGLGLLPDSAQATAYTWTGTTSNAWELGSNWGSSAFPNAYTDQATIGTSTNNPVTVNATDLAGTTSGNALTISNYSPNNAVALDIVSTGTLGLQGGISISSSTTNAKQIRIEGILRNDGTSGTPYSISGGTSANDYVLLNGGTISSLNGGIWAFARPVQGYGTISSPFTSTNTISANVSSQTLHITGTSTAAGTLTSSVSGAILSLESSLTGATLNHTGEIDLNGATLTNLTLANSGTGAFDVTGNSTLAGTISRNTNTPFTIIGTNTLNLSGATFNNVSGGTASIAIGTGTLNNSGSTTTTISNGDPITLAGGKITSTGGGTFTINTQIVGNGTVLGPLTSGNSLKASGGILYVDGTGGTVDVHGTTVFTNGQAGDVLDLRGNINFGSSGFMYSNPSGNTGNGEIRLDGATLNGTINVNQLGQGAVNVVNDSSLVGTYYSSATLGINSGKTFNVSGSTLNVNVGSLTSNGTLAIGTGTLNNLRTTAYSLGGTGSETLAGGSITSTGGGAFASSNTLSGYGNVSASFTNNGKVIANGNGTEHTLSMQAITPGNNTGGLGWFAQNHGELTLPSITVSSDGAYNWGGDPTTLGMVNSVGIALSGVSTPGTLSAALLSPDRVDVPAGLVDPVGVWQFTPVGLQFGTTTLTFRYDNAAAAALGVNPSQLHLFHYDGTNWDLVAGTTNDTTNYLLTAGGLTSFSDYAIAVPEPATMGLLALATLGMTLMRRSRRSTL